MKTIKKYSIILALGLFSAAPLFAQEKYSVVLEQSKQLSPYEAIYLLMDYQQLRPELGCVYYELGNLCYGLLPTRDPLHHYEELTTLLYQSRLFYGNCLHFSKDQRLHGWQYAAIANGQKRIEYEQLERYIKPRLEDIKRQQIACDSIHNSFVRLTDRYNVCRMLFTDFLTRYTREKTAHLQLEQGERAMLERLQRTADSVEQDIISYQQALALDTIAGYAPVFRKEAIELYRLDGLTHTDFLQNDIALWDYSAWVKKFLDEQVTVYESLYRDLDRERQQLEKQIARYTSGQSVSGKIDESLLGRCARLGLRSPEIDSIGAMQAIVRHGAAEQSIAKSTKPTTLREFMPVLQLAAAHYSATPDSAQQLMISHVVAMAEPLRGQQQDTYTHPVTGEIIRYTPAEGETVQSLQPDDKGFYCVVVSGQETKVLVLSREMEIQQVALRLQGEKPSVCTKMPGGQWILVTDKNIYLLK